MSRRFEGKNVMVTGAGTGFGACLALQAATEGAKNVVVHYRSSDAGARATADKVRELGSEPLLVQGDISIGADIERMAEEVYGALGSLDVLVNNVGDMAVEQQSWREVTEEMIDRVLAVDIKGTMLMVHHFGRRMLDAGSGAIVNIGSTVIVRGSPRAPQYAAGKYGVLGITKSYAKAFGPHVRVNTFAPGFMETEALLARQDWNSGRGELIASQTPAGRIPKPEELAAAALYLASDEAHHITGSYMICDGGYSMLGA